MLDTVQGKDMPRALICCYAAFTLQIEFGGVSAQVCRAALKTVAGASTSWGIVTATPPPNNNIGMLLSLPLRQCII
jgi:hypothetical protein